MISVSTSFRTAAWISTETGEKLLTYSNHSNGRRTFFRTWRFSIWRSSTISVTVILTPRLRATLKRYPFLTRISTGLCSQVLPGGVQDSCYEGPFGRRNGREFPSRMEWPSVARWWYQVRGIVPWCHVHSRNDPAVTERFGSHLEYISLSFSVDGAGRFFTFKFH